MRKITLKSIQALCLCFNNQPVGYFDRKRGAPNHSTRSRLERHNLIKRLSPVHDGEMVFFEVTDEGREVLEESGWL